MQFVQQVGAATALQLKFLNIPKTWLRISNSKNLRTLKLSNSISILYLYDSEVLESSKHDEVNMLIIDFHQISILAKT